MRSLNSPEVVRREKEALCQLPPSIFTIECVLLVSIDATYSAQYAIVLASRKLSYDEIVIEEQVLDRYIYMGPVEMPRQEI